MKRTLFALAIITCTVAFFSGLQTASAEFIGDTKDSAEFNWKYEMDVTPITQDLDGNTGDDWSFMRGGLTVNGDGTITLPYDSGDGAYGTIISAGGSDPWAGAGHVWQNISNESGFTFEIKLKSAGEDQWITGAHGGDYIVACDGSGENYSALVPVNEKTYWDASSKIVIDSNANDDAFHTFRIAQKASDGTYYVWRDGELISESAGLMSTTWYRLQIGDLFGAAGPLEVDYIRLMPGAFAPAPVPEPSTLALLTAGLIGLLAYAWRKRK